MAFRYSQKDEALDGKALLKNLKVLAELLAHDQKTANIVTNRGKRETHAMWCEIRLFFFI